MDLDGDQRGDELERLRPYLHLIARMHLDYRLRSRIDPEDVVQDVFRKAIAKWDQCRESRKPWLRHILLNHLKDLVDKMTAQKANVDLEVALEFSSVRLDALLVADHSSPSQKAAGNEEMAKLAEALAKLPLKQQSNASRHRFTLAVADYLCQRCCKDRWHAGKTRTLVKRLKTMLEQVSNHGPRAVYSWIAYGTGFLRRDCHTYTPVQPFWHTPAVWFKNPGILKAV